MKTKQDYLNLLEDTINYYSDTSKRALVNTDNRGPICVYKDPVTNNKCAVGRFLKEGAWLNHEGDIWRLTAGILDGDYHSVIEFDDEETALDFILEEEYRGYRVEFWGMLQNLHDSNTNWNDKGLSPEGEGSVNNIKTWIEDNIK